MCNIASGWAERVWAGEWKDRQAGKERFGLDRGSEKTKKCEMQVQHTNQLANRKTIIEFSVIYRAHVIPLVEQSAQDIECLCVDGCVCTVFRAM